MFEKLNTIARDFMARSNARRIDDEMRTAFHGVYQVEIVDKKTNRHIRYINLNKV